MMNGRQNWMQLSAVQAGGAICLPVFVVGHALAQQEGIPSALFAIGLGNAFLLVLALIGASYSSEKRLSTVECAVECFGSIGKGFFSAAMVVSMVGWFAIQLHLMALSLDELTPFSVGIWGSLCLGAVMTLLGMRGLQGLKRLATISMPLLLLTIGFGLTDTSISDLKSIDDFHLSTTGVSLVLACSIAAVIDLPTFFRVSLSRKDAVIAVCVLFGLVIPFVEGVGVILFASQGNASFLDLLMHAHASYGWKLWVLGFVLLAGWTTNSANLYSATVSLGPALSNVSFANRALMLGSAGTLLSCLPLMEGLEGILQPVGVVLASMGAVLTVSFLFEAKAPPQFAFLAWGVGAATGGVSVFGYSLTGIAVLDAFAASLIMMGGIRAIPFLKQERIIDENV
jgi:cytosine permease